MNVRFTALAVALIACTTPALAAMSNADAYGTIDSLPTHETYSAAATIGPVESYLSDISFAPGVTASISGSNFTASASTTIGDNHAYAQAGALSSDMFGVASFSGWYDQVTITGGTGGGSAQFTVEWNGNVDAGAYLGVASYGLFTTAVHPNALGTNIIANPGTETTPWFLIANKVTPIIQDSLVASPYNDPSKLNWLFSSPFEEPSPNPLPNLVLIPGMDQSVNLTLTGTLNFTYGEAFYLISALHMNILDLNAFQSFCSFDVECQTNTPTDGIGATTLDFSNSANLINIALPEGASANFASGETYNVTSVPEPAGWLMLLTGLGLVCWRAQRRA